MVSGGSIHHLLLGKNECHRVLLNSILTLHIVLVTVISFIDKFAIGKTRNFKNAMYGKNYDLNVHENRIISQATETRKYL